MATHENQYDVDYDDTYTNPALRFSKSRIGLITVLVDRGWLSLRDFATLLGYASITPNIRRWAQHSVKVGRNLRVPEIDIRRCLEARSADGRSSNDRACATAVLELYHTAKNAQKAQRDMDAYYGTMGYQEPGPEETVL